MKFEDYVKEEFEKIDAKIDKNTEKIETLLIFMAVEKAKDSRMSKITSGLVSLIVSLIVLGVGKLL